MLSVRAEIAFLGTLLRLHRGWLLAAMLLAVLESALALSLPWFAGQVTAALLQATVPGQLLLLWVAVLAVQTLLTITNTRVIGTLGARLSHTLGTRVYDHLQALPLRWHHARKRGELLSMLDHDVFRLSGFATHAVTSVLPLLLTCIGALYLLLRIEPRLGLAVAAAVPVYVFALKLFGRRLHPLADAHSKAYAERFGLAEQNLTVLPLIKAYTREPEESARFATHSERMRLLDLQQMRIETMLTPLVRFVGASAVIAMLWFAGTRIAAGSLSTPELVSLLLYGMLLTQPVAQLAGVYGRAQIARGAARRLHEALAEAPEPDDGREVLENVRGELVFNDVAFAYPGRPAVYTALNLQIRAGETVAITGSNGAGKSTLAYLLLRFADPTSGSITLDGKDLRSLRLRSLRSRVGLVSQQVLLLNESVACNIGFGRLGASRAEIEQAARAAHAHEFIVALPQGYDTPIGDDGVRLSGGQKQRLALARALLLDAQVLILDEATAMFDPAAERAFIDEFRASSQTRTLLLITHRPASLALADRVLHLDQGVLRDVAVTP